FSALLLYDWAVTLPIEQDVVWSRKMNVASVLYILARVCKTLVYVQDVSAILPYFVWAGASIIGILFTSPLSDLQTRFVVFSTYRGYALSGRKGYVAAIICMLTLVPIGVNLVRRTRVLFLISRVAEVLCTVLLPVIVSRTSLILADILAMVVTWWHTR
ncbi:uncharacterized protein TRAVEDRAFT_101942, partial [Trametes versicolor FP-101664 SS1]|uniref:uncharacterized protein n=1 Tax=Trametes versicolor (strain FP-101664) TaxID=717944 RepID=UPI0004622BD9